MSNFAIFMTFLCILLAFQGFLSLILQMHFGMISVFLDYAVH